MVFRYALIIWATIISGYLTTLSAQAPDTIWTREYGGETTDIGHGVIQTPDGGYFVLGLTSSFGIGGSDIWLLKTNASGETLWTKTYGGFNNDAGWSIIESGSGYVIGANTQSFDPDSRSDIYLLKIDVLGNILWSNVIGGDGDDWLNSSESIRQTGDGGYIITGTTTSYGAGARDVFLVKTDSMGNVEWTKTFGGSEIDDGWSVQQTLDGGYIIAGMTVSFGAGNTDAYIIKTDASGETIWTKTFGGPNWDDARSVSRTMDGGYIFTGHTESFGLGCDVYLVKINSSGDTLWTKTYGGMPGGAEGNVIKETFDNGYIIAGYTITSTNEGDIYLIKTDSLGNLKWHKTIGGLWEEEAYAIQQTSDSGYIIAGFTLPYGMDSVDLYLVKVGSDIGMVEESLQGDGQLFKIFPNPARNEFTIHSFTVLNRIRIFNIIGKLEREYSFDSDNKIKVITIKGLLPGVYFLEIFTGGRRVTEKLVLIR